MPVLRVVVHLADQRLPAVDDGVRKRGPHRSDRRGFELLRIDIRIRLGDRPAELREDLVAPPNRVSVERREGEQKIAHRRREEDAGVEDEDGQGAGGSVGDTELGVSFGYGCHFGESLVPFPAIGQDVRRLEPAVASHHVRRNAALVDETDEVGA